MAGDSQGGEGLAVFLCCGAQSPSVWASSSQIPSQEARSACADAGFGLLLHAPRLGLTVPSDPLGLLSVLFSFFTLDQLPLSQGLLKRSESFSEDVTTHSFSTWEE